MKTLTGKATRLSGIDFDKDAANKIEELVPQTEAIVTEENVPVETTDELEPEVVAEKTA